MKELDVQRGLCNAAIAEGGYAYKANNRFLVGVADLHVQLPGLPGTMVEVKFERKFRRDGIVMMELTAAQARFIERIQRAGGKAGWVMVVGTGGSSYTLFAGHEPLKSPLPLPRSSIFAMYRSRGQPWPIQQIVHEIVSPRRGL